MIYQKLYRDKRKAVPVRWRHAANAVPVAAFRAVDRRIERGVHKGHRPAAGRMSRPKSKCPTRRSANGAQAGGCVPIGNNVNVAGAGGTRSPRLTVPTWDRDLRQWLKECRR
jgi:hypothetical protein